VEQGAELVHQPRGRIGDPSVVRVPGGAYGMGAERVEARPVAHIVWVADKGGIDPAERLD